MYEKSLKSLPEWPRPGTGCGVQSLHLAALNSGITKKIRICVDKVNENDYIEDVALMRRHAIRGIASFLVMVSPSHC
ncbi:hypothetical protein C1H69_08635 [Billgrantia endophytica]|uniref:Uncharacterized protein n=1 Tax=Billgrantia endophytica TaxID=2033802 RepID=A0A2N7U5J4_9GAMM|nr:hypothetical protein C1H69_08635 [Halomonas endophytica]